MNKNLWMIYPCNPILIDSLQVILLYIHKQLLDSDKPIAALIY